MLRRYKSRCVLRPQEAHSSPRRQRQREQYLESMSRNPPLMRRLQGSGRHPPRRQHQPQHTRHIARCQLPAPAPKIVVQEDARLVINTYHAPLVRPPDEAQFNITPAGGPWPPLSHDTSRSWRRPRRPPLPSALAGLSASLRSWLSSCRRPAAGRRGRRRWGRRWAAAARSAPLAASPPRGMA
jgi:hypothetical protein